MILYLHDMKVSIANSKNEFARCVANVSDQIWSRGLESFLMILKNKQSWYINLNKLSRPFVIIYL